LRNGRFGGQSWNITVATVMSPKSPILSGYARGIRVSPTADPPPWAMIETRCDMRTRHRADCIEMTKPPIDFAAHRRRRARRARARVSDPASRAKGDAKKAPSLLARILARREKADTRLGPGEVRCARCHAPIPGNAKRCSSCGVHFNGRAEDFAQTARRPRWIKLLISVLLLSFAAAAFLSGLPYP
jgi:hypothetical protein